ncbi:MAG: permease [bacterium]|nr:permease [bacterium]
MDTGKELSPLPLAQECVCNSPSPAPDSRQTAATRGWNRRYFLVITLLAALWWALYSSTLPAATWLSYRVLDLGSNSHLGASVEFFFYDSAKILLLLVAMIYAIGWIRASMNVEQVRAYLLGKHRGIGYFLGSGFGAITPFCSCSSIPLFLGFTSARIPIGITMAFLITSPLINEIAVVLLWGLLGWKFTIIYVVVGLLAGILGGWFMDGIRAERWLQPFILETLARTPVMEQAGAETTGTRLSVRRRHEFAYSETVMIFKRVWKWVFIGVGVGAALHGFVPENWFAENLGAGQWWTVPVAVIIGIPLYSNVTGIVPVMQSLLVKGMPIGTTMAFCMSSVAASIPEFLLLRQIMTIRLQAAFIAYLWVIFTLVGWLLNAVGPYIR